MKFSEAPIVQAIVSQTLARYNNYQNKEHGDISIESYEKHKEAYDAALIHAGLVTFGSYSSAGFVSVLANYELPLEAVMSLTGPSALFAASIGAVAVTGYLNKKLKDSDYLTAKKQIQEKLSEDFGVRFNLNDFNDNSISNNLFNGMVSAKILSSFPILGARTFFKKVNKLVGMGFKENLSYMKNNIGIKFCDLFNKCGGKIGLTLSKVEDKKIYFKKQIDIYNKLYNSKINNFIDKMFSEKSTEIDLYLEDKYQNEYNRSRVNKERFKKKELYLLNRDAIKLGYEMILIQNTQLAFINCLRDYCKEKMRTLSKKDLNINEDKLNMLKNNLDEFKDLYNKTKSNNEDIPEYKIFDRILNDKNWMNENKIKDISLEGFGETVSRINENLSLGRLIKIVTLKSAILFHRTKLLKGETQNFREDYQHIEKRLAIVGIDKSDIDIFTKKTIKISKKEKVIEKKNYKKITH